MSAPHWKMRGNFLSYPMELIPLGTEDACARSWRARAHKSVENGGIHLHTVCQKELIKVLIMAGCSSTCKKELIKV